jgi:hypothetical protein
VSSAPTRSPGSLASIPLAALLVLSLLVAAVLPPTLVRGETLPDHLVISEVVTGAGSASDELIELYNPTAGALPLEGLELVYVTASGATISRRAIWELGAPTLGAGRHLLVANELGIYAPIADAVYASGMAATGGSVALRIQGATTAIDAVGWGTAASTWLEGAVAVAPPAGSSLERLPGGVLGSTVDSDDNAADFALRSVPDPQNTGSPAVPDPSVTPSPVPTPAPGTPAPSPEPSFAASPTPGAGAAVDIELARGLPDGTEATIEGVALTGSSFTDGGGYVADATGGIAVIVTDGSFERGFQVRLTGELDDRFSQRTLRVDGADLVLLGSAPDPGPQPAATGAIGESLEGELVRVTGTIAGSATALTTGLAYDLDDSSGVTRLVVATTSEIDTTDWEAGTTVDLVGVVGQRDSTGSGTTGYRVQPRDAGDVRSVTAAPSATPQPSGETSPDPSASPSPGSGVITIAAARELPKNARARVRGTVTLASGVIDPATAVVQDPSGAIVLRLGDEVGGLTRGQQVEVDGVRSTKSGMETMRVTTPPARVGTGSEPTPRTVRTGEAGEAQEALLVVARGGVVASARRASSGTVSLEIDDGSGPLRVVLGAALGADAGALDAGTWLEVRGILGQDTTGAQPLRGYRIWPRDLGDLRVIASATAGGGSNGTSGGSGGPDGGAPATGLDAVGAEADPGLRIGATLVSGPWPELSVGGLLWDGMRLMALELSAGEVIDGLLVERRPPMSLELTGLRAIGSSTSLALPLVRIPDEPAAVVAGSAPPAAPSTELPTRAEGPRWVALVGRLAGSGERRTLVVAARAVAVDRRCDADATWPVGQVGVIGIAFAAPARIVIPCHGVVPVPVVTRAAAAAAATGAVGGATTLAGMRPGLEPGPGRQLAPVALLALAAAVLLGGIVVARRLGMGGGPEPDEPVEAGELADAVEPPTEAPTLALVPLPHERAR